MYSLIATCRMNNVDPEAWLRDVLARLPDHPAASSTSCSHGTGRKIFPTFLSAFNPPLPAISAPYALAAFRACLPRISSPTALTGMAKAFRPRDLPHAYFDGGNSEERNTLTRF